MKMYSKIMDSSIEWFGTIPIDWRFIKGKFLFGHRNDKNHPEEPLLSVTQNQSVVRRDEVEARVWNPQNDVSGYKLILDGDFVISLRTFEGGIELSKIKGIVSPVYTPLYRKLKIEEIYFKFLFKSERFITELNKITTGIRQGKNISYDDFSEIILPFPPLAQQQLIGEFLGEKTSIIEDLLQKKLQKIKFLKEQRISIINHAVTKGLIPDLKLINSGKKWLGDIPKHWNIIRLRYLGNLQNGISKDAENFGFGFPFLNYGDVYKNDAIPEEVKGLVNSSKSDRDKYSVIEGDVFFTRTSESIDDIGISSVCLKTIPDCVFSGFVIRFRKNTNSFTTGFSKYYLKSHFCKVYIENSMNLVTRASLSQDILKSLPILLPPIEEQEQIVKYLDKKTSEIDKQVDLEIRKIDLLKEYRQSLISEVVTGKIDVRTN